MFPVHRARLENLRRSVVVVQGTDRIAADVFLVLFDVPLNIVGIDNLLRIDSAILKIRRENKVGMRSSTGDKNDVPSAQCRNVSKSFADKARMTAEEIDISSVDDGAPCHVVPFDLVKASCGYLSAEVQGALDGNSDGGAARLGRPVVEDERFEGWGLGGVFYSVGEREFELFGY